MESGKLIACSAATIKGGPIDANLHLSIYIFQFSNCNFQYFAAKGDFPCLSKVLKNENCKLCIAIWRVPGEEPPASGDAGFGRCHRSD
jgi:hypothetical protein